ncbi:MAG: hypothetical protein IPJ82_18930 [Lewinellaceae bacterium]|nr:hypothetical protein [Lewinellaceae bacterium]
MTLHKCVSLPVGQVGEKWTRAFGFGTSAPLFHAIRRTGGQKNERMEAFIPLM